MVVGRPKAKIFDDRETIAIYLNPIPISQGIYITTKIIKIDTKFKKIKLTLLGTYTLLPLRYAS